MTTQYVLLLTTLEECLTPERVARWAGRQQAIDTIGFGCSPRLNPFASYLAEYTGLAWHVTHEKASLLGSPFLAYPLPEWVGQCLMALDTFTGGRRYSITASQFVSIFDQTMSPQRQEVAR